MKNMRSTGRETFSRYIVFINIFVKLIGIFPKKIIYTMFVCFRDVRGKIGILLRYICLKNLACGCGVNVAIHQNVFIFNLERLTFGDNVSIHPMCYIDAAGGIEIGSNVSIAHSSSLISANHTWKDFSIPIKYNEEIFERVILEDDIWLGCGVRILAGVHLKRRSIVAAGAVVNKSFDGFSLVGGVPAKLIKKINE